MLLAGCLLISGFARAVPQRAEVPVTTQLVKGPLAIEADFALEEGHPLLEELSELRQRVASTLGLPITPQPIRIHLYSSSEAYYATLAKRFPGFPVRRAFFVKHAGDLRLTPNGASAERTCGTRRPTPTCMLCSTTYRSGSMRDWRSIRILPPRPMVGTRRRPELLKELHAGRWRPDLVRLELLPSSAEMTQLDYAEAWAWTYSLLHTTP